MTPFTSFCGSLGTQRAAADKGSRRRGGERGEGEKKLLLYEGVEKGLRKHVEGMGRRCWETRRDGWQEAEKEEETIQETARGRKGVRIMEIKKGRKQRRN